MIEISTEAVILRSIPFRENDRILSIFTFEAGLIKVIHKGNSKKGKKQENYIPLTLVELSYREKRGEIFDCLEMSSIDSFSKLRKELLFLEVGCDLLNVILSSQLVGKAAPQLYALLIYYLKRIHLTQFPWTLAASFRLKLLKHDGIAHFPFICSECQKFLGNEAFVEGNAIWCENHRSGRSQQWNSSDLDMIYRLATSQNYREICSENISIELLNRIAIFFQACTLLT